MPAARPRFDNPGAAPDADGSGGCSPDGARGGRAPAGRAVRLPWLVELAGPDGRHELLDQLAQDLARAQNDLRAGLSDGTPGRVSAACHVLVSLAGTLGDGVLTARLQGLQRRLREDVWSATGGETPGASDGTLHVAIDALRAEVEAARHAASRAPGDAGGMRG